jgi:hypothetical protein
MATRRNIIGLLMLFSMVSGLPSCGDDSPVVPEPPSPADGTTFLFRARIDIRISDSPADVCSINLDGDGASDLVVVESYFNRVLIFMNDGDGVFRTDSGCNVDQHPRSLFPSDLDGDGDCDLAAANRHSNNISILINTTND